MCYLLSFSLLDPEVFLAPAKKNIFSDEPGPLLVAEEEW